eukprot:CAMPEP_0206579266 /NCGR_PEP_ID=MMETSP0325_2-20121206/32454_1 /ASSEMBLY_ACC=CAM_ASM_000347 /TAXON_ID=2866 /ORGANISM="Crypthecodinium cohnii, Strain Seligo" /LENGTH=52 /DNA_ID=CAMNT_0054085059 /DNA_START=646 /DNA_END=804 /DNA_ORIENTATION=-
MALCLEAVKNVAGFWANCQSEDVPCLNPDGALTGVGACEEIVGETDLAMLAP